MESPSSSKKRISLLWKRLFNIHRSKKAHNGINELENNSPLLDEENPLEDCSQVNIGSKSEPLLDCESNCPQTILKKSHTNPSRIQSSLNNSRHATFMEVVKVHEYVMQDTLANEEHYTSEASLTDDDENYFVKDKFYLENEYSEGDDSECMASHAKKINVLTDQDSNKGNHGYKENLPKGKKNGKSKKQIKSIKTNKKTKFSDDLIDDVFFDFAC